MNLQKILMTLNKMGIVNALQLSEIENIPLEEAEFAIQYWLSRGKIKKQDAVKTCQSNCNGCGFKSRCG